MKKVNHSHEEIMKSIPNKGFFGHPKGLSTLFLTEFWERFSYYGMKAILIFYLYYSVADGGFGLSQAVAMQIVAIYGTLIYMSGLIGGWIADRITGTQDAVFYGGFLIMFGHILLSIPGNLTAAMIALLLIIAGTGLLKPNISTTVGELYERNDPRRDAAFTLFYMGINLGALLSPLITGQLQTRIGFHAGFLAAAIGMFFGLIVFALKRKKNLGLAGRNVPIPLTRPEIKKFVLITVGVIVLFLIYLWILHLNNALTLGNFSFLITLLGIVLPVYIFLNMILSKNITKDERSRVYSYVPLYITSVAFWMIQEQGSTILATFADKKTQLEMSELTNGLIDFSIPAAWAQSLNPIFIVLLAPIFATLWMKLGKYNPPTVHKFAIGTIIAGFSYLIMIIPLATGNALINPLWLVLSFLLITIGELCISPVGLSTTTKLAPLTFTARMMSLWMLSNATAQGLNAQLVVVYTKMNQSDYFMYSGLIAVIIGILLLMISPKVRRAMKGVY
ncbi:MULTISPECIES: peptide MFS transporter [Staphylococcus]|uniref:Peptide transporter n=2 Tax=Staphylococcus equorum TaxID=246432 RepID=A0AAP7IDH9_9STAP|nr:peptide MFS transporter [Staphylococcus equorum]ANR67530.1 peptide transporter [Staphylococcus equorum]ERH34958.1 peptide ABC transporter permease [Staphylococcus equorum UMC-CNS-924]KKI55037.1 Di/tripeptide permease YjdL [Staphylococcus equorum subsp. equorum]MCE5006689.1 peptide MFS transporter [Staphylococcus equorum]MCE5047911.1 peptide MFS transporter [Staphylococcus equorum]